MNPKGIIITFFIISLLLIGMMFLIVDVRNNPVVDDFITLENEFEKVNQQEAEITIDSLESTRTSIVSKDQMIALETFTAITEDLLTHIQNLQEALYSKELGENINPETPRVEENNALFFKENGTYTNEATQFIAKLDAFEDNIRTLQKSFSALNVIKTEVRQSYTNNQDWLSYNFKDFPAIASYVKLTSLYHDIKTKREDIFTTVLNNQ
ncbi:hypothetical protein [Kordia sp.]|uniref:hypothetical protein n=1 Tax=Kordia sp. TaxID=1965332 RepID=UPI003B59699F